MSCSGPGGHPYFCAAAFPAQAAAVTTQSSLASLPVMLSAALALRVDSASAGLVLPLAVSLFRAASAAANAAVAVYLAQLHGVPVSIDALILARSLRAAVGLPAQVSFFTVIAPLCVAMGVPVTLLPLVLAIETLPNVFRTLGNVTADLTVMRITGFRGKKASPASNVATAGAKADLAGVRNTGRTTGSGILDR